MTNATYYRYPLYQTGDTIKVYSPDRATVSDYIIKDTDIAVIIVPGEGDIIDVLSSTEPLVPAQIRSLPADAILRGLHPVTVKTRACGNYRAVQESYNAAISARCAKLNMAAPEIVRHR